MLAKVEILLLFWIASLSACVGDVLFCKRCNDLFERRYNQPDQRFLGFFEKKAKADAQSRRTGANGASRRNMTDLAPVQSEKLQFKSFCDCICKMNENDANSMSTYLDIFLDDRKKNRTAGKVGDFANWCLQLQEAYLRNPANSYDASNFLIYQISNITVKDWTVEDFKLPFFAKTNLAVVTPVIFPAKKTPYPHNHQKDAILREKLDWLLPEIASSSKLNLEFPQKALINNQRSFNNYRTQQSPHHTSNVGVYPTSRPKYLSTSTTTEPGLLDSLYFKAKKRLGWGSRNLNQTKSRKNSQQTLLKKNKPSGLIAMRRTLNADEQPVLKTPTAYNLNLVTAASGPSSAAAIASGKNSAIAMASSPAFGSEEVDNSGSDSEIEPEYLRGGEEFDQNTPEAVEKSPETSTEVGEPEVLDENTDKKTDGDEMLPAIEKLENDLEQKVKASVKELPSINNSSGVSVYENTVHLAVVQWYTNVVKQLADYNAAILGLLQSVLMGECL